MTNGVFQLPAFWRALAESGSVDKTRGMQCFEYRSANGLLRSHSKTHSYGEYIFDWSWANAYAEHGVPYYPKLVSMIPFTPVTHPHFLAPVSEWDELLRQHEALLPGHSSSHFLFTTAEEQAFLAERGYLLRDSFQYHFFNEGEADFEKFLARLKAKKAKHVRQERQFPDLQTERLTSTALDAGLADEMYGFYQRTLDEKGAIAYLTRDFFRRCFVELSEHVLYVRARRNESTVAGALFFYDQERLYGRYWGANEHVPNLHFELCYYQGIDCVFERGLKVFEAGAQGEHKIARGFRPVKTRSAHKLVHPGFHNAVAKFVQQESGQIDGAMRELTLLLPFKK